MAGFCLENQVVPSAGFLGGKNIIPMVRVCLIMNILYAFLEGGFAKKTSPCLGLKLLMVTMCCCDVDTTLIANPDGGGFKPQFFITM